MRLHSYPKVWALGHPNIRDLLLGEVAIQEKYDGSQLTWGWDEDGKLHVRSKGKEQYGGPDNVVTTDNMFGPVIEYLLTLEPHAGFVFRGELLNSHKHNSLTYERPPKNRIVLFDVETQPHVFLPQEDVAEWAHVFDVDIATTLAVGEVPDDHMSYLLPMLDQKPMLGGNMIEGIVIKNYRRFGEDGKILAGKVVRDDFKELHSREWKKTNKSQNDLLESLIESLNTEARWEKAIQHLRDNGELLGEPRDIGPLLKEIKSDVLEEEEAWIVEKILSWVKPKLSRSLGRGFPEYYKRKLAGGELDV